jgi:hypothetical protein
MLPRLLTGIFTAVFLPLGVTFVAVGLLDHHPRHGAPIAFVYTGAPLAVVGVGCGVAFLILRGKEAERRRRRQAGLRATAEVVSAELNPHIRSGALFAVAVTLRIPGVATAVERTLFLSPWTRLEVGAPIEVLYDPAEPSNFELVAQLAVAR